MTTEVKPLATDRTDASLVTPERPSHSRQAGLLLAVLLLLTVGIRLSGLTTTSLWYDEGYSIEFSGGSPSEMMQRFLHTGASERFQPIYFYVLSAWRAVLGDTEVRLRLLSVLFGCGTSLVLYLTAKRVFGAGYGLWTLAFTCVSAYSVQYSQEVRPYGMLMFVSALQVYLFVRAVDHASEKPEFKNALPMWLLMVVASFGSLFSTAFCAAIALAHIAMRPRVRDWVYLWIPSAIACLPAALFYLVLFKSNSGADTISQAQQAFVKNLMVVPLGLIGGLQLAPPIDELRGSDAFKALIKQWPVLTLFAVAVLACVFRGFKSLRDSNWQGRQFRFAQMMLALLFLHLLFSVVIAKVSGLNWLPRHAYGLYIPIALLLPLATRSLKNEQTAGWVKAGGVVAMSLLLALNVVAVWRYFTVPEYERDNNIDVAQYLKENSGPTRPAFLLWGHPIVFDFYGVHGLIDGRGTKGPALPSRLATLTGNAKDVILVVNREYIWTRSYGQIGDVLAGKYELVDRKTYHGFSVYNLRHTDGSTQLPVPVTPLPALGATLESPE